MNEPEKIVLTKDKKEDVCKECSPLINNIQRRVSINEECEPKSFRQKNNLDERPQTAYVAKIKN